MPCKVLIVEDDSTTADLLCQLLGTLGDTMAVSVIDNISALGQIEQERPDLICTDIYHPGPTGIDLVHTLLNAPQTADIPIVVISGNCSENTELMFYRIGVAAVFHKPFSTDTLIARLGRILHIESDSDIALLKLGLETRDLDYKEFVDLSSKESQLHWPKTS